MDIEVKPEIRLCKVGDEYGYFHTWEQYSVPIPESPLIGWSACRSSCSGIWYCGVFGRSAASATV